MLSLIRYRCSTSRLTPPRPSLSFPRIPSRATLCYHPRFDGHQVPAGSDAAVLSFCRLRLLCLALRHRRPGITPVHYDTVTNTHARTCTCTCLLGAIISGLSRLTRQVPPLLSLLDCSLDRLDDTMEPGSSAHVAWMSDGRPACQQHKKDDSLHDNEAH